MRPEEKVYNFLQKIYGEKCTANRDNIPKFYTIREGTRKVVVFEDFSQRKDKKIRKILEDMPIKRTVYIFCNFGKFAINSEEVLMDENVRLNLLQIMIQVSFLRRSDETSRRCIKLCYDNDETDFTQTFV